MITQDTTHRFVSDTEKDTWNNKLNKSDVSQSTAVTVTGQKALDAVEKNAAVPGTMAYDLAQINSNLIITEIQFTYYDKFVNWGDSANSTVVKKCGSIATFNLFLKTNEMINNWVKLGYTSPLLKAVGYNYVFSVCDTFGNHEGIIALETSGNLTIKPYSSWDAGKILHATITCIITT